MRMRGRDHMSIVCCFTYSEFVTVSTRSIKISLNRTHRPSTQIYNRIMFTFYIWNLYNHVVVN